MAMSDSKKDPSIRKRRLRIALMISLIVHVCLLVAFVAWRVQVSRSSAQGDPAWVGTTNGTGGADGIGIPEALPPESPAIPADLLQANIDKAIAKSDTLDDAEKLDKLDEQIAKLEATASDETIDELSDRFREWMGAPQRASQPADQPVEGDFDSSTAQFHEVTRTESSDGQWQYRSVLVDAQGRTLEVELGPDEGRTAYETMQRLKRSPLVEKLYRQITMQLLDRILQTREDTNNAGTGRNSSEPDGTTLPE